MTALSSFFRKGGLGADTQDMPGLVSVKAYLRHMRLEHDRKATDADAFLQTLDAFPWDEAMAVWLERQEGPLPALVLCRDGDKAQLGVSGVFNAPLHYYQFSVERELKKGWFSKQTQHTSFEVHERAEVAGIVQHFARGDWAALAAAVERVGKNVLS